MRSPLLTFACGNRILSVFDSAILWPSLSIVGAMSALRAFLASLERIDGTAAQHRFGLGRDRLSPRIGSFVLHLDQQPAHLVAAAQALQREAALQLLTVQPDQDVPRLERIRHR